VFHPNYGAILLSFRDMTTGRTTDVRTDGQQADDGRRTDNGSRGISWSASNKDIATAMPHV